MIDLHLLKYLWEAGVAELGEKCSLRFKESSCCSGKVPAETTTMTSQLQLPGLHSDRNAVCNSSHILINTSFIWFHQPPVGNVLWPPYLGQIPQRHSRVWKSTWLPVKCPYNMFESGIFQSHYKQPLCANQPAQKILIINLWSHDT